MLNMGIPFSIDFEIRLPGIIGDGFYHNFSLQNVADTLSDDESKWLQCFLTLKVDKYDCGVHTYFYIKAILEGKEMMDIEACQKESEILRVGLAAQLICDGRKLKK